MFPLYFNLPIFYLEIIKLDYDWSINYLINVFIFNFVIIYSFLWSYLIFNFKFLYGYLYFQYPKLLFF
jgi:hypothetical protein